MIHNGNLQVGWLNGKDPVFLDCFRPSGGAALYRLTSSTDKNKVADEIPMQILSSADFDVPRQPIDFTTFLVSQYRPSFEQISTSRLDPRFASGGGVDAAAAAPRIEENSTLDIVPAAGTLVLFDSVSLPHQVQEVTGNRQRIAATGWFHEDSQFVMEV